jgi:hypothetical protein
MSSGADGERSQDLRWRLPLPQRQLLRQALATDDLKTVTPEQQSTIREICATSEIRNVPPEQFVVGFKAAILSVVDELGIAAGPTRSDFVARLMTVCIQQFYASTSLADGVQREDGKL